MGRQLVLPGLLQPCGPGLVVLPVVVAVVLARWGRASAGLVEGEVDSDVVVFADPRVLGLLVAYHLARLEVGQRGLVADRGVHCLGAVSRDTNEVLGKLVLDLSAERGRPPAFVVLPVVVEVLVGVGLLG